MPRSKKITIPAGDNPVTTAVNVADCPNVDGFGDDDSAVVVAANPNAKWSSALVVLVPTEFATVTSTVPLLAGEVAVIDVALMMVNEVALVLPNFTTFAPMKLSPVMVTAVPPDVGPLFGEMENTFGGAK